MNLRLHGVLGQVESVRRDQLAAGRCGRSCTTPLLQSCRHQTCKWRHNCVTVTSRYVNEARGLLGLHGAVVSHLPRSTSSSPAGDVEEDESLQLWQLNLDPVQPNLKHKPARVHHHHVILTSARDRNRVALPRVFRVIFFWHPVGIPLSRSRAELCACARACMSQLSSLERNHINVQISRHLPINIFQHVTQTRDKIQDLRHFDGN